MTDSVSRVLDRRPHFDARSRQYSIRALIPPQVVRVKTVWDIPSTVLDQGSIGACVGFGWSGELSAAPVMANQLAGAPTIDNSYALNLYSLAQAEDRTMGNTWPEGASVLAGAKAVTKLGLISEYRWAFGIDDCADAIVSHGPCVLGIPWYESMFTPDARGRVTVSGNAVGGHCIVAYGYTPADPNVGGDTIWLRNSWGSNWGINGTAYIATTDLARLLSEDGECCIPADLASTVVQPDPADAALAAALKPWAATRHYGANEQAARDFRAWLVAKHL
jgi:hypothetical protein